MPTPSGSCPRPGYAAGFLLNLTVLRYCYIEDRSLHCRYLDYVAGGGADADAGVVIQGATPHALAVTTLHVPFGVGV